MNSITNSVDMILVAPKEMEVKERGNLVSKSDAESKKATSL